MKQLIELLAEAQYEYEKKEGSLTDNELRDPETTKESIVEEMIEDWKEIPALPNVFAKWYKEKTGEELDISLD